MTTKKTKKGRKKSTKVHTYSSHRTGRSKKSILADSKRKAKAPGKRRSKTGRKYTEDRPNRSDIKGFRV